jgi:hypothetical protein
MLLQKIVSLAAEFLDLPRRPDEKADSAVRRRPVIRGVVEPREVPSATDRR